MNRQIIIFLLLVVLLYSGTSLLCAQHKDTVSIYYRKGSSMLDPNFRGNGKKLHDLIGAIEQYQEDSLYFIQRIDMFSKSSPEGKMSLNESIAINRGREITSYLGEFVSFGDSVVFVTSLDEDWDYLLNKVQISHDIPNKMDILKIFASTPPNDIREKQLKQLGKGMSWEYMDRKFFPNMRAVDVVVTLGVLEPMAENKLKEILTENDEFVTDSLHFTLTPLEVAYKPLPLLPIHNLYIKTNVAALGIAVANLALEADLGSRMSAVLPIYYSAWDYFGSNTKFRTFTVQPEIRYWFGENHKGVYAGIHAGLGWYNMALGGDWRIQDKDGNTPAIGGGLNIGYRIPLLKNNDRLYVEFGLGIGAYAVTYDKFYNKRNGALESVRKKTYIGPDQASINLIYQLGRLGRNRK